MSAARSMDAIDTVTVRGKTGERPLGAGSRRRAPLVRHARIFVVLLLGIDAPDFRFVEAPVDDRATALLAVNIE